MKKLYNYLFYAVQKNFFLNILRKWKRLLIPLIGMGALFWFLIRVIPKPSRAFYPCQRAAFPLASGFIIWLLTFTGSYLSFMKARQNFRKSKYARAMIFSVISLAAFLAMQIQTSTKEARANSSNLNDIKTNDTYEDSSSVYPKSVVAIVQSNKQKAEDIDSSEICEMVRQAVEMAGGLDGIVHDNSVVVLKPNMVVVSVVDDNINPVFNLQEKINSVTTDYRVIQAVVNVVREKNPHGKIYIMEGSAQNNTYDGMKLMGWLKIKGADDFICLDRDCGYWRDTTSKKLVKVHLPNGKALYSKSKNTYYLNKIYYDADVVISIPVLKTHCNAAVTGAVKNVGIGATPLNIYGMDSTGFFRVRSTEIDHGDEPDNYSNLHKWIHDFYMCKPVNFAIMDALTGMQNGPSPFSTDKISLTKKNTRCIIASKDALAMDAIEALIVQVDPLKVNYLNYLHNENLGCANPKYIRVKGKRVDEVKDHYANYATYATYYDFNSPSVTVNSYDVNDDSLNVKLNVESKVVKVEFEVNGTLIDKIFTKNFENLTFKINSTITNPKQVRVFAYDRYLNCSVVFLDNSPAGISTKQSSLNLIVYPNPFENKLTIEYNKAFTKGAANFLIYNMEGQNIYRFKAKENGTTIDLSSLKRGNYILLLKNDNTIEKIKITKK